MPSKIRSFGEKKKELNASICIDIWDKEKRWKYYSNPIVAKSLYDTIHGHPFRFRYVSTTERSKTPENLRDSETGVGVWKRMNNNNEVLHIPDNINSSNLIEYLKKLHSGITEIHYEPSVFYIDGTKTAEKVQEIIVDMDVQKEYPFNKVKEVAELSEKIAPKIIEKYLGISPNKLINKTIFTGKTSFHQHLTLPKGKEIKYGGVKTMDDPNTVSGIICKISDEINRKLGEDRVVCGEGHGNKIGFDFASCNAPGKNCVAPFSFRIPDEKKEIYTCHVAVPVNFKKLPNFNPNIHATADFVMKNPELFE